MLINCRECKARVSDEAKRCPRCGCRAPSTGQYTEKGVEIDECFMTTCGKCARKTEHRHTVFYQYRYTVVTDTCKNCGRRTWRRLNDNVLEQETVTDPN